MPNQLNPNIQWPSINDEVVIVCYGKTEKMSRRDAMIKYHEGMVCCDGSERERYTNIFLELLEGRKVCSDV